MASRPVPCAGSSGVVGLPLDPHDGADGIAHRRRLRPKQDHGGRAVARDVGAGGVDDVGEIHSGKNSSISFLPNSRFMKELAVIMPDEPGWLHASPWSSGMPSSASWKNRSVNGTASEYLRWQVL